MKTKDFSFYLPDRLISYHPSPVRGEDRLLALTRATGAIDHKLMSDLPDLLPPGALLVFNDSRVRKARLFGETKSGATAEFLLIKKIGDDWLCLTSNAKRRKPGSRYAFEGGVEAEIVDVAPDGLRVVKFFNLTEEYLEKYGRIPLPPYIKRRDELADAERYQTVYARDTGSAAAPTAGLHFTQDLLEKLNERGFGLTFVTLHVGLGTFAPVREENMEEHHMHSEHYKVSQEAADTVNTAKQAGRPIVAVGTTACRVLESASDDEGRVAAGTRETSIFIYPGYRFKVIDALFTNFHTPESTLLALVTALAGKEHIDKAYAEAVGLEYKFFSYGDAMLIR